MVAVAMLHPTSPRMRHKTDPMYTGVVNPGKQQQQHCDSHLRRKTVKASHHGSRKQVSSPVTVHAWLEIKLDRIDSRAY